MPPRVLETPVKLAVVGMERIIKQINEPNGLDEFGKDPEDVQEARTRVAILEALIRRDDAAFAKAVMMIAMTFGGRPELISAHMAMLRTGADREGAMRGIASEVFQAK